MWLNNVAFNDEFVPPLGDLAIACTVLAASQDGCFDVFELGFAKMVLPSGSFVVWVFKIRTES